MHMQPGAGEADTPAASAPSSLPDIIAPGLSLIFCGINPGIRAAATGRHFEGRGNRFWRVVHLAGFTPELLQPENDRRILEYGCGLTTVVSRPTARADQLSRPEFEAAATTFRQKIGHYAPRYVAFLGKAALAGISGNREIEWGRQPDSFAGAQAWVLPNPSGLNRAFSLESLVSAYRELSLSIASSR